MVGELKRERNRTYLVLSRQLDQEKKIHAEYHLKNGNLRIYLYKGDVVARAFYDDDNDGKVETVFIDGCPYRIKETEKRSFLFFKTQETKELEKMFVEADQKLAEYKNLLNVEEILGEELQKPVTTLSELMNAV